ncbi:UV radiation resistance-associated gene protein isoform X3 [Belonocnema kinseyi]|uniref:UV radiation resistance-associated gene protein isoform X3 n=1 Tax=Belonocnema kinseyi TaxID=2817044 RepID=UPI00143DDB30|nr:UV radiation resistance-associated gene protein isoform X3 [Belonocnema kinseyi]
MEMTEIRNLVRDLDLTLQPRTAPRYKVWLQLATQQLRFRSLIQVIGHNLKKREKCKTCWFYYTIHRTCMSSPSYTSEPIDSSSPRWESLEVPILHATGHSTASEIILRLWRRTKAGNPSSDVTVFTWGISFTGLSYIGSKLPKDLENILRDNSLIFKIQGGFFVPAFCFVDTPELKRFTHISVNSTEVKDSYSVNKLCSLRSKMQALKQQSDSVQALREKIASGDSVQIPRYPQSSLNRLLQPKKVNREKKVEIFRVRKELEIAKFRAKLLEQERVRKMSEVRILNQLHLDITEQNQDHGSELMERYRELNKDMERLQEWRQNHIDVRETFIQSTARLAHRRRQLISELNLIYPVHQESDGKFRINNVFLPDSESLESTNDTDVAVALGFVAHTTQMIANFLNIPLRYPIVHYGSRSKIIDHITESLPDSDRQFPLFARSKDKLHFHYAVYLLNKNIAQLRWYCGLPTVDLRATLPNLSSLINARSNEPLDSSKRTFSVSSLDAEIPNNKLLTPPLEKILFEKCHRTTASMSQLKASKTTLGSSLDQGLDKPIQSLNLNSQSKRICKSAESAIDYTTLTLPRDTSSISSNETLNETVFKNLRDRNSSHQTSFSKFMDEGFMENNIEITIPTSVSKPKTNSNNEESSTMRQRSSNSISSCEMALSNSQFDGEESSNGNSEKYNDQLEYSSTNKEDAMSQSYSISESYPVVLNTETVNAVVCEEKDSLLASETKCNDCSVFSKEITDSTLSLDGIVEYTERSEQKQRAISFCSDPAEGRTSPKIFARKRYDSESRKDQEETQILLENLHRSGFGVGKHAEKTETDISIN